MGYEMEYMILFFWVENIELFLPNLASITKEFSENKTLFKM